MKILILSDIPAPYRVAVFKGLSELCDATVFFNSSKNDSRNDKFYVSAENSFRFHILNNEKSIALYEDCIRHIKDFDVVLCYDAWHKRTRALARLCMKRHIPYVLNADGALGINMSFLKRVVKTFYTKRAALCLCGCKRAAEYFSAYGAKKHQLVMHPFTSVSKDKIIPAPMTDEQKADIRASLGMENIPTFISVGQFIHRKGFDILLRAWAKTSQSAQLYIIGGGPLDADYKQYIVQNDLKNVHIVDFMVPEELEKYYLASDVYLMPTREDIWGLVINEAMAYALPIITSTNCTAGNELVKEGENGFLYPFEDETLLASHIERLANDPVLRAEFAKKALAVAEHQTLENIVSSHWEALQGLVKDKK